MKIGIIMAAGKGERMRPLTLTTPKPLIAVNGRSMIDTVIEGLQRCSVDHIYVVVGYLKDQFEYLIKKYSHLTLVENHEYETKNNISSISAVRQMMKNNDCYVCEADLYISDTSFFDQALTQSCYFGKYVEGYSDDWVFEYDGHRITRIGRCGENLYNMVGVSYFKEADSALIADAIEDAYSLEGHESLYWDEVVNDLVQRKRLNLSIVPVGIHQIIEIDTIKELQQVDLSYCNKQN